MGKRSRPTQQSEEVEAYMQRLEHPLKPALQAVRETILAADDRIREAVKWNSPSFRVDEFFATATIRPSRGRDRLQLILHRGAKAKDNSSGAVAIDDPTKLLTWLADERCLVDFDDLAAVHAARDALAAIVRQWIAQMESAGGPTAG